MPYDPLLHQQKRATKVSSAPPSGPAGGDLSGTYPNPTVARINGNPLGSTTPNAGHVLLADGTVWKGQALSGDATVDGAGVVTLANTAVTPGTYGDATHVGRFTVDAKGRLTAASNVAITGSGATATEVEVDFGASPIVEKKFTVSDGSVTGTSKIVVSMSASAPTGKSEDDNELDPVFFQAGNPGSGSFDLIGRALCGPIVGKVKAVYMVA